MQALTQVSSPYFSGPEALRRTCLRMVEGNKFRSFDFGGRLYRWAEKDKGFVASAMEKGNQGFNQRKRKVVEHVCLVRGKEDLSEENEKNMLDYLYTTQYQMPGIVATSLGRVSDQNPEHYTHAIFMRFRTKEDLFRFYEHPSYKGVLKEHVDPYSHGFINLDFESEVEDDMLPIFRKGEDFNYGVELILLLGFQSSSLGDPAENAMASLANLALEFPSLIVQATEGSNFNTNNSQYSHGAVIRFRSSEAMKIFLRSSEYNAMWTAKFNPFIDKFLSVHFSVDPIGTELM